MPRKRHAESSDQAGEQIVKKKKSKKEKDGSGNEVKYYIVRGEEVVEVDEVDDVAGAQIQERAQERAQEGIQEGAQDEAEEGAQEGACQTDKCDQPLPKRKNKDKSSTKDILKAQAMTLSTALKAFGNEISSLRLEVEMVRVQREQQREWNKAALAQQAKRYEEEIENLKGQLKWRDEQREEMDQLRAEVAELRDFVRGGSATMVRSKSQKKSTVHKTSSTSVVQSSKEVEFDKEETSRSKSHRRTTPKKSSTSMPQSSKEVEHDEEEYSSERDIAPPLPASVKRIQKSIEKREVSWTHFVSQKGNYMFAANLENGLKSILDEIRDFNIQNPQLGEATLDIIFFATKLLYKLTVAGNVDEDDKHNIDLKLAVWDPMDKFAAMVLKGLGWKYRTGFDAFYFRGVIRKQRSWLKREIRQRLKVDKCPYDLDSWFTRTAAGLDKAMEVLDP